MDKINDNGYVPWKKDDWDYFGAGHIVEKELETIESLRGKKPVSGIALSGGGIRSASFALGVLQALSYRGWLSKIDYLSTVSGGGYIGTCLSYLLHKKWKDPNTGKDLLFSLDNDGFPLGSYPLTGRSNDQSRKTFSDAMSDASHAARGEMLRYLRQRANYLLPGEGISLLSLIGVVLRNTILSVTFFLALITLMFWLFGTLFILPVNSPGGANYLLWFAGALVMVFIVGVFFYGLFSWFIGRFLSQDSSYTVRRHVEINYHRLLILTGLFVVLGSVSLVYEKLVDVNVFIFNMNMPVTDIAGSLSALSGVIMTIMAFMQSGHSKRKMPVGLLSGIAALALLFGLLLLGYEFATRWIRFNADQILASWIVWSGWAAALIITLMFGWLLNLNYISIHRYYRDRLMETFMPDINNLLDKTKKEKATAAIVGNNTLLRQMWGGEDCERNQEKFDVPYHIINANVILVSSRIPKFRGRGGDNFIFSPLFCGSAATGWAPTKSDLYSDLSLASAMAISGAAVNPNSGCGGEGPARQRLFAMLMGLLNIRLGYWLPNPKRMNRGKNTPNLLYPGLQEVLLRKYLDEESCLLQLSDGGHFENLGLYELVRRRLSLIIVCDGAADPGFKFSDLANAVERVRADFGTLIEFDGHKLEDLIPTVDPKASAPLPGEADPMSYATQGFLVGKIYYADKTEGTLIYITTTIVRGLSPDIYGYRREHPVFPDEPTSDQFFDEKQFEAYRELGFQLADLVCKDTGLKQNADLKKTGVV